MVWLNRHPHLWPEFSAAIAHVCADELTLVRETEAVKFADRRYMQRCFRFAHEYLAVIEWNHANRIVRVHECHRMDTLPPAA